MNKEQYIGWLRAYFARKQGIKEAQLLDGIERENYFSRGLIDSLGIVELIEAIERQFDILIQPSHFEEKRFATIDGLAEIIGELCHVASL